MNVRERFAVRVAAYRKWVPPTMPDMPTTPQSFRRGFGLVRELTRRLELPLPIQAVFNRGDLSWADHLTVQLTRIVRESAMGNRETLKQAAVDLAAASLVFAETIEARGP